jgi:hypothetical protein
MLVSANVHKLLTNRSAKNAIMISGIVICRHLQTTEKRMSNDKQAFSRLYYPN